MKKIIFILLLLVPILLHGQPIGRYPIARAYHVSVSDCDGYVFTEDFQGYYEYDVEPLYGQGNWLQELNTISIIDDYGDKVAWAYSLSNECAVYYDATIDEDQYSEGNYKEGGTGSTIGLAVRCQGGTGSYYAVKGNGTIHELVRVVSGSETVLDNTLTAWSDEDVIRLEIVDYTLQIYINDILDTNCGTSGSYTDTDAAKLSGGYVGLAGYGSSPTTAIREWEGGEICGDEPGYDYTNLEHWYPLISDFDDAHGTDNGTNTGAYQGDSTINGVGATYFEESEDDYVTLDNGTNYGSDNVSLFVIYKPHQFDGNVGIHSKTTAGAACFLINGDAHPVLYEYDGNLVTSTLTLLVGYENFVGWSYNQTSNKVRFYVNGSTEVLNYVEEFGAVTDGIGGSGAGYSIDGLLQNLAIWSDTLTEANFDYYYNSGDFKGYEE